MRNDEWCLFYPGTDYTFGLGDLPVFNRTTPDLGDIEVRGADANRARGDGITFGTDFLGNRTIGFDLGVRGDSETAVRDAMAALSVAWRADVIRQAPGVTAEMRMRYRGEERVVFGRPRRFAPILREAKVGYASAVADFVCSDDRFYSQTVNAEVVGIVPALGGGLLAPLGSPLTTNEQTDRSKDFTIHGELPAWPVIEIRGPIVNPKFAITSRWHIEVNVNLAEGDTLVIDTQPWARTITVNGSSWAGFVTRASTRLSNAALPPGSYEFSLAGVSGTGTAIAIIRWRDAFTTL